MSGGYDASDTLNCLIVDNEPILNFNIGIGYDLITSYSQIAKDYDIIKVNGGCGYLYPKSSSLEDIKDDFYNVKDGDITRKDVNYYDVYNYDLIVSYGDDNEGKKKARLWFKNKVLETTPKEKTKWM